MKHSHLFNLFLSLPLISSFAVLSASANDRPDYHAPIGVMRDHVHDKGEYMLSYRYKYMQMQDPRSGSRKVSESDVLRNYMMSPQRMEMKMHMLGAMYGITDRLTIAVAGSIVEKDMKMVNRANQRQDREVSGFGDSKINAMYKFFDSKDHKAQFNLGLSIPTGNIKQEHDQVRLGYPMQLGSGSYEAMPGLSYSGYANSYSYGAQINATFRLNSNNSGYKVGDSYQATSWIAKKLCKTLSVSSRLNYMNTQQIEGVDIAINKMMTPVNNISSSGRSELDFLVGANFIFPSGLLKGNRLAIEGGMPLYQNINGTALSSGYNVTLGWQKSF